MRTALALIVLASLFAAPVRADKCRWSADPGTSANGKFRVVPTVEGTFEFLALSGSGGWEKRHAGKLSGVPGHPHLETFVPDDGSGFIVVNTSGGHEIANRIVLYAPDGQVRRAISLAEFLRPEQLNDLEASISHIRWLSHNRDPGGRYEMGLREELAAFWLRTKFGTEVYVELPGGRVLDPAGLAMRVARFLDAAAQPPARDRVMEEIRRLDSNDYAAREAASGALVRAGFLAAPVLREALGSASPEQRRRLEAILAELATDETRHARKLHHNARRLIECLAGAREVDGRRIHRHLEELLTTKLEFTNPKATAEAWRARAK